MEYRVLFTAMGSIGTRHLKNLKKVLEAWGDTCHVDVIRRTDRQLPVNVRKMVDRELYDCRDACEAYDMIFITSITALHYDEICFWRERSGNLFIEKPVLEHGRHRIKDILPMGEEIFYVAAPMRYTDVYRRLKEMVSVRQFYSARILCSSYMPGWQKGRDYRQSFRTREKDGGGVDIDLIHEIDYMAGLFGMPRSVQRMAGKYSDLEMRASDLAVYLFEYEKMLVEVHLDYFGRKEQRYIELYGADEVVRGDFLKKEITRYPAEKVEKFDDCVDHYYREMENFVMMVKTHDLERNINPVSYAVKVLRLAKGEL